MERFILNKLLDWKNSPYRKPLILKGVRQVGKTWILKEFGRQYYENTAYFNFDENEEYKQFFETTKDVNRILQNLMLASGQKIMPEKTLIIFDEVQDCPKVINSIVLPDYPFVEGDEVVVLVSGLGATPVMELYVLYNEIEKLLIDKGIKIHKSYVGNYFTSLDMMGATLTVMKLDDELKELIDMPVNTMGMCQK